VTAPAVVEPQRVLAWVKKRTDGQLVELARRICRTLTKTHDIDVPELRRVMEDFVRNVPKLILLALVAMTGGAASPGNGGMASSAPNLPPSAVAPGTVTDLRVTAVTDTSVVLTWTEVSSGNTSVARYLVRYAPIDAPMPATPPFLTTGGCGAPIYGSTAAGGRVRSCVLGGLTAQRAYAFQVIPFTGTLTTTANWGGWSNTAQATTAARIGSMVVSRPPMHEGDVAIAAASITDFGSGRFPLHGTFRLGDRVALFYDSTGAIIARGYVLVTRP